MKCDHEVGIMSLIFIIFCGVIHWTSVQVDITLKKKMPLTSIRAMDRNCLTVSQMVRICRTSTNLDQVFKVKNYLLHEKNAHFVSSVNNLENYFIGS